MRGWDDATDLDPGGSQTLILEEGRCLKLDIRSKSGSRLELFARVRQADGAWSKEPFIEVMSQALGASLDALEAMEALQQPQNLENLGGWP